MAETRGQAISRVEDEQMQYLERFAAALRKLGLNVETKVGFGGDAGEQILEAAKELGMDAIFMATHGRTALGQIVFGSVAEKSCKPASALCSWSGSTSSTDTNGGLS